MKIMAYSPVSYQSKDRIHLQANLATQKRAQQAPRFGAIELILFGIGAALAPPTVIGGIIALFKYEVNKERHPIVKTIEDLHGAAETGQLRLLDKPEMKQLNDRSEKRVKFKVNGASYTYTRVMIKNLQQPFLEANQIDHFQLTEDSNGISIACTEFNIPNKGKKPEHKKLKFNISIPSQKGSNRIYWVGEKAKDAPKLMRPLFDAIEEAILSTPMVSDELRDLNLFSTELQLLNRKK